MKQFEMTHDIFNTIEVFTQCDAPKWLTSEDSVKGSTMDNRWFWFDHVLTLGVGQSIETDFRKITRIN